MSVAVRVGKKLVFSFQPAGTHLLFEEVPDCCRTGSWDTSTVFWEITLIFPMWTREPSNHVEFPMLFPGRTVSVLIICKACWDPQWQATPDEKNSVKLSDSSVWSFVSMRILNFHSFMRWNTLPETTTGHDEIGFASWKCRCILQHLSPFGTLVLGVLEGMLSDITYP